VRRLKPWRAALAVFALVAAIATLLAAAAAAPGAALGAIVAGGSGMAVAAIVFSVWEWSFHRYLYHRDRGGLLRPLYMTHHRDHHFVYYPPWRLTTDTWDDGSAGAHPSVWTPVVSTLLGRQVTVSDSLVYLVLGAGLMGGVGAFATGRWAFLWGTWGAGVAIGLTFTRVHAAIHHPGSHPLLERLPWFPFLARHHYLHHLDTEANANFLLPLADWLFGTLRLPEPRADLLAAGRAMAPWAAPAAAMDSRRARSARMAR
jgi:sterol desaturase/sphingolipid hydroxylase (fatty acid hydroxylase superfamily)